MKKIKFLLSLLLLSVTCVLTAQSIDENNWQNGDIIFIKNAQMANSQSSNQTNKFNCVGIIFRENGHPMVYYGAEPLKKCAMAEFLNLAEGKKYSVKWLAEDGLITEQVLNTMRTYAQAKLGTPYDNNENLNNEELYNAEFVWKIYRSGLGVNICEPKVKELTASGDNNKKYDAEKDGSANLSNKFIGVMDLYKSELLE